RGTGEVVARRLDALVARHAVGEADLPVGAGADADVIAELPVVQVVPAATPGPGKRRGLIVLVAGTGQCFFHGKLHIGAVIVLGQGRRATVERRVRLDRQLIG